MVCTVVGEEITISHEVLLEHTCPAIVVHPEQGQLNGASSDSYVTYHAWDCVKGAFVKQKLVNAKGQDVDPGSFSFNTMCSDSQFSSTLARSFLRALVNRTCRARARKTHLSTISGNAGIIQRAIQIIETANSEGTIASENGQKSRIETRRGCVIA